MRNFKLLIVVIIAVIVVATKGVYDASNSMSESSLFNAKSDERVTDASSQLHHSDESVMHSHDEELIPLDEELREDSIDGRNLPQQSYEASNIEAIHEQYAGMDLSDPVVRKEYRKELEASYNEQGMELVYFEI